MDINNYMECCSLLTQKLHFIISVESGSYAIETISAQSMGSKRQFLCQKKSGIIGRWYLFFFLWKLHCRSRNLGKSMLRLRAEREETGRQKQQGSSLSLPSSVCSKFHVMCQHSSARHICIFFLLGRDLVWEIRHFEFSFKVIYRQSQDSNPDLTIVKPKFLLWICQQKQGSSCQGIEPLYTA